MTNQRHRNWLKGAESAWPRIDELYAKMYTSLQQGRERQRRRLRRRLFYTMHAALAKAHYKGRLLRAIGDLSRRRDKQLNTLLASYAISKKERDYYNCLLVADSLATFFVEEKPDGRKARFWIDRANKLLVSYPDPDVKKHISALSRAARK